MRFSLVPPFLVFACFVILLLFGSPTGPRMAERSPVALPAFASRQLDAAAADLRGQAAAVDDLSWLSLGSGDSSPARLPSRRTGLLAEKQRLELAADPAGIARLNSVLAAEAFARAGRVVDRWIERKDPASNLLPVSTEPDGQAWVYGDTGADLYGHLTIGSYFLARQRYPELLETLAAERRLGPGLPDDVTIPGRQPLGRSREERIFGVAEYAKDGLLPLLERLGPDPWLGRLVELADAIIEASATPTSRGPIPADSAEVNGDMLQVLTRLGWATGESRFVAAADRIALAYLDVLPTTRFPPHRWDFVNGQPIERRRFRLSDHGNEVLSGLLEWHLAETLRGDPVAAAHRDQLRRLLDRLLERGRNEDGLWYRVVEIPSGRVEQEGLTDNWGYLLQAYLIGALVEDQAPNGEPARAAVYRQAARQALEALPSYQFYEWQRGEMDGYADSLESAVYLLNELEAPAAERWLDQQMAVLYGFQAADGSVLERDLDGNFIRTLLLYAFFKTQGLVLEPWREGLRLGAARDGDCLAVSLSSPTDWDGRLIVDAPRHRAYLRSPLDYARLNKWPEWFVARPGQLYFVGDAAGSSLATRSSEELTGGIPVQLRAAAEQRLSICPT